MFNILIKSKIKTVVEDRCSEFLIFHSEEWFSIKNPMPKRNSNLPCSHNTVTLSIREKKVREIIYCSSRQMMLSW